MAAPAKRRNVDEDEDDSDLENEEFESEDEMTGEEEEDEDVSAMTIPVDLAAQTPSEPDFHGIKRLLLQLFLKESINVSALTDVILAQNHVGSVIKQADDEMDEDEEEEDDDAENEVFAISTVINVSDRCSKDDASAPNAGGDAASSGASDAAAAKRVTEGDAAVKGLVEFLLRKSDENGGAEQTQKLRRYLKEKESRTGWLLNERFVNIPPEISLPLYDSLREELHSACAKGHAFHFDHFLLVSKALKRKGGKKEEPMLFTNGEEELFHAESSFSFSFSVADQLPDAETLNDDSGEGGSYEPWRVVMILQSKQMEVVAKKLTDALGANIEGKVTRLTQ